MTVLLLAFLAAAQPIPVESLVAMVRQHTPAKTIHRLALSEQLDLQTIEELESEGVTPETLAALEYLRETSAALPLPTVPVFPSPPAPSPEDRLSFLRQTRANAMHYAVGLPNFICTEIVHRYSQSDRGMIAAPGTEKPWQTQDTLTVRLTYFNNQEKYDLSLINGRKAKTTYQSEAARAAISEGDFGSLLVEIFSPDSATQFQWDHWTHVRKRLTRVYSFRVSRERAHYEIGVNFAPGVHTSVAAGRHGLVFVDEETHMVTRIVAEADSIPSGFPVDASAEVLDYDFASVGDRQYLLPLRANLRIASGQLRFRNLIEFRDYRKFTGESKISFEDPH